MADKKKGGASAPTGSAVPDKDAVISSLKAQLALRSEAAIVAEASSQAAEARLRAVELLLAGKEENARSVALEMAREAKVREDALRQEARALEAEVERLKRELVRAAALTDSVRAAGVEERRTLSAEASALRERMEDLCGEFADLLGQALNKMGERVQLVVPTIVEEATEGAPLDTSLRITGQMQLLAQMQQIANGIGAPQ